MKTRLVRALIVLTLVVGVGQLTSKVGRADEGGLCLIVYSMEVTNCPGLETCAPEDQGCQLRNQAGETCRADANTHYLTCMGLIN